MAETENQDDESGPDEQEEERLSVTIPPQVSVDKGAKGQIIAGVKAMLDHLGATEKLPPMSFDDMLNHPLNLQNFCEVFESERATLGEFMKDAEGNPVEDDETLTSWGVTLPQIERLLISTAARRHFTKIDGQIVVKKTKKQVRSMLVFKKTVTEKKKIKANPGSAKFNQMKGLLGFPWQLPMLDFYRDELSSRYVMALGEDLLYVQDVDKIKDLVSFDSEDLRKAKEKLGDLFPYAIHYNPMAIRGCMIWQAKLIPVFVKHMRKDAWVFFAREKDFIDACADLDAPRIEILGPFLAYIDKKSLISLLRLDLDRLKGTVGAIETNFGSQTNKVIAEPTLDEKYLAKLVDNFIHVEAKENSQFVTAAESAIKALREDILAYVDEAAKKRAAAPAEDEDDDEEVI